MTTRTRLAIAASVLLAVAGSAWGQTTNLTKSQEGRLVVGQCYSKCAERVFNADKLGFDWLLALASGDIDSTDGLDVLTSAVCTGLVATMREADACHAGCIDAEAAYGVRTSFARNRFTYRRSKLERELRSAGLWQTHRDYAEGDAFDDACDRFWLENLSTAGTGSVAAAAAVLSRKKHR